MPPRKPRQMVGHAANETALCHLAMLRPQGASGAVGKLPKKRMVTHEHSTQNRHEAAN